MMQDNSGPYTVAETAQMLGVSRDTVRLWIKRGELKAANLSRNPSSQKPRIRIFQKDIDRFIELRSLGVSEEPRPRRRRKFEVKRRYV